MRPELELLSLAVTLLSAGVLGFCCERASARLSRGAFRRGLYFASLAAVLFAARPPRAALVPKALYTPLAVVCVASGVLVARLAARRSMLASAEVRARGLREQLQG